MLLSDMVVGLEELDKKLGELSLTPMQKKKMTKAGALVFKEALKKNLESSLHKGKFSRSDKTDLSGSIGSTTKGGDGATYVGFRTGKGNAGYIARLLNDGYMAHGGHGTSAHSTRYITGLHFQERTITEIKAMVLAAELKEYKKMLGD